MGHGIPVALFSCCDFSRCGDGRCAARDLADRIAEKPPLSVSFIKGAVNTGLQVGLEAGLQYERLNAAIVLQSEDRTEGMKAFVEKRKPVFRGV